MTGAVGPARLDVPVTANFREVAPGVLVPGRLYRSDALHRLTRTGRRTLAGLGVETVVDLRSSLDRRLSGRDRLRGTGVRAVAIPIDGVGRRTDLASIDLRQVYRTLLTRHGHDLAAVVRLVAEAENAVVVHCTAGKDRTGLAVALILSVLGIDDDVVVADYAATEANLAGPWTDRMLRRLRRMRVQITPNLLELLAHSPEVVLRDTLDWLRAEHGDVAQYLAAAGVDEATVDRLRRTLLPA